MIPLQKTLTCADVDRILRINDLLRLLDDDITPIAVSCFLYVASHDGCHKQAMEEYLDLSTSSGSRNTDFLSEMHRLRKPGLDLIRKEQDRTNRRRSILTLTEKGRRLATQIKRILNE
tara:strand:+ start:2186 stop:2539 length:354 start_codon:yes stop_codon:yes gene_type:complete